MNRCIFHLGLLSLLLSGSSAFGQNSVSPPPDPTPPPGVSPEAYRPTYVPPASTAAPSESSWPPPTGLTAGADAPPVGQPADSSANPSLLIPVRPVAPSLAPWLPDPSPGLGLTPGASNPIWDVSVDALWLARDVGNGTFLGATTYNPNSHAMQTIRTWDLWSDDSLFPLEPGIRLQLIGRLSDRTAVEANCWGLQQWSVGQTIYGDHPYDTVLAHTDWLQTSNIIGGFDKELGYSYRSQVANVEFNYRTKLNTVDPYRALSWMWGVRYFYLADDFTLSGSDLSYHDSETLNWRTKNNLIGPQLGLQWAWGWDRLQLSTEVKGGLYANVYTQRGSDSASGTAGVVPFDVSRSDADLAAIFEISLLFRYRITECVWVRAGYQYYCATGLALGPRQLGGYDSSGTVGLDGLSLGLEVTR
jgi:hypothetical protein